MTQTFQMYERATLDFDHKVISDPELEPHRYWGGDDIYYVVPEIHVSLETEDVNAVFDLVGKMIPEDWWPPDQKSARQWVCVSHNFKRREKGGPLLFDLKYELLEVTRTIIEAPKSTWLSSISGWMTRKLRKRNRP